MSPRHANLALAHDILHAAAQIVEECGPDCVTMRQVADKIGYSPTTIYLYYKDKQQVLAAALLHGFEELADFCNEAMVGPTALDEFRQRCRAYVVWGLTHPGLYRLMFEGSVQIAPDQLARATRGLTEGDPVIRRAVEAGQIGAPKDATVFGSASWAALHGVVSLAISERIVPSAVAIPKEELAATTLKVADTLVEALLASLRG